MPRKTKETNEKTNALISTKKADTVKKETATKATKTTKSVTKKTTAKKDTVAKAKPDAKKSSSTKNVAKKTSATVKSVASAKATTAKKVATTKKKSATTSTSKKVSAKTATKKATTKKTTISKRKNSKTKKAKVDIVEYYDLPYRYNQTVVKVLAQTPNNLFIYWDISDKDRENYKAQYGENFFETTKPVLIIHNTTMNYSFEIDINDFANSWYLHVNDAKCDYTIELGRRPIKENPKITTDYIYISTSNDIEAPNDHILFNKEQKMVYFRNVKTGVQVEKPISANISFIRNMGKIYNIYDIYKAIYQNEHIEEIYDISNPSSGNPTSGSLSSKFK